MTEFGLPSTVVTHCKREQPVLVNGLHGNPSYWLVPMVSEDRLVGFLRLGLKGELLAYGRFGQGQQLRDFPAFSCLSKETADKEIREAFGDNYKEISAPRLSDESEFNKSYAAHELRHLISDNDVCFCSPPLKEAQQMPRATGQ
jgi:hypothetical protein